MRQVILDTETTGLEPEQGHRIIEIGCVELINRRPTGKTFHQYLKPDREIDDAAVEVHGITTEFLADKPRFGDITDDFMKFVSGAELVIHNAPFDVAFIESEFRRAGVESAVEDICTVLDTLPLARSMHPGQRNSLDALCKRYEIDNSGRELHGALLDARILADVYLAMTGGQGALSLDGKSEFAADNSHVERSDMSAFKLRVVRADSEELSAHENRLDAIEAGLDKSCVWRTSG